MLLLLFSLGNGRVVVHERRREKTRHSAASMVTVSRR